MTAATECRNAAALRTSGLRAAFTACPFRVATMRRLAPDHTARRRLDVRPVFRAGLRGANENSVAALPSDLAA